MLMNIVFRFARGSSICGYQAGGMMLMRRITIVEDDIRFSQTLVKFCERYAKERRTAVKAGGDTERIVRTVL